MHIISRRILREFWAVHPDAEPSLDRWFRIIKRAGWRSLDDVRAIFSSADQVGNCVVFNIGGNKYRLITAIHYSRTTAESRVSEGRVFVLYVLTHRQHDQGKWKDDCC